MVEFFYRHVFYFGELVGDKGNVAGVAGLTAEGDGRHVRGVGLQEHLVDWDDCCGVTHVLCVVECDDSGEADVDVGIEFEELFCKFARAGKAVNVDVAIVQARGAEHGEGVVIGFAEVEHEWLTAFEAKLQMTFEKFDLGLLCFCAVVVVESKFSASDAFGMLQKFHHASFIFGRFCFDVFGMDAVCGVDERVLFAEFAGAVKICWVAGDMDKCFGALDFYGGRFFFGGAAVVCEACVFETFKELVEGFFGVPFVRVNVAMRVDEHRGMRFEV